MMVGIDISILFGLVYLEKVHKYVILAYFVNSRAFLTLTTPFGGHSVKYYDAYNIIWL